MERIKVWVEDYHGRSVMQAVDTLLDWFAGDDGEDNLRVVKKESLGDGDEYTLDVTDEGRRIVQTLQSLDLLYIEPDNSDF